MGITLGPLRNVQRLSFGSEPFTNKGVKFFSHLNHFHFLEKSVLQKALRVHQFLCFADLETKA